MFRQFWRYVINFVKITAFPRLQFVYTVSQKNDNDVAHYNFNAH